jgi:hypothetical protein
MGAVRRRLTRSTSLELSASYFINDPLLQHSGYSAFNTVSGNFALEHRFARGFDVRAGYGHDHQSQNQPVGSSLSTNADKNRAWISFSYSFQEALGR